MGGKNGNGMGGKTIMGFASGRRFRLVGRERDMTNNNSNNNNNSSNNNNSNNNNSNSNNNNSNNNNNRSSGSHTVQFLMDPKIFGLTRIVFGPSITIALCHRLIILRARSMSFSG